MTVRQNDGLPEDRVTCLECRHCDAGSFWCRVLKQGTVIELPRRCLKFQPEADVSDQRPGRERWPWLKDEIESMRALGQAYGTT